MIIGTQGEPVMLVGHSYGGAVITEAGNDPKVAALVYIAAFVPDQGESVETIIGNFPPGSMMPPILPCDLCVAAGSRGRTHRKGRFRSELCCALSPLSWPSSAAGVLTHTLSAGRR
jgi:pimeloyl-ACP methyl ester carboxylesterase